MDKHAPKEYKQRKLVGWRAWYVDGSSYNSDKYKWKDIPQKGFMGVKRFFKKTDEYGKELEEKFSDFLCGQDLYIIDDEYRNKCKISNDIKIGEWMCDCKFHPMLDYVKNEEIFIEEML